MTRAEQIAAAERMAEAAAPWIGRSAALELARNIVVPCAAGDDPYQCAVEGILHRIACGWLTCAAVHELAQQMAIAWRGHAKLEEEKCNARF